MDVKVVDGANHVFTIAGNNADKLRNAKKFWLWFRANMLGNEFIEIRRIEEKWSLWRNGELAFALFWIEYFDKDGEEKSTGLFYRSDAVAVFLVLKDKDTGEKYVVLVQQLRVAAGGELLEIPAGCIELGSEPNDTAVREITEEVGLKIRVQDLYFCGEYFFSPGACNEKIVLYSCELELSGQEIKSFEGRLTGLKEEGENIRVRLFPLETFGRLGISDAKTQLTYELYMKRGRKR